MDSKDLKLKCLELAAAATKDTNMPKDGNEVLSLAKEMYKFITDDIKTWPDNLPVVS